MPVTNYIWDVESDNVLMETDGDGATTAVYTNEPGRFGQLVSQRRGGVTSYHHFDGQGSTRQLTDQSGNVTDTATYSAFGETVASSGSTTNPFGYKGALGYYANPETSDLYVRARTYNPIIARWLSQDPLGLQRVNRHLLVLLELGRVASRDPIGYEAGYSLYSYVQNSPLAFHDPQGAFAEKDGGIVGPGVDWSDVKECEARFPAPKGSGLDKETIGQCLKKPTVTDQAKCIADALGTNVTKDVAYWAATLMCCLNANAANRDPCMMGIQRGGRGDGKRGPAPNPLTPEGRDALGRWCANCCNFAECLNKYDTAINVAFDGISPIWIIEEIKKRKAAFIKECYSSCSPCG